MKYCYDVGPATLRGAAIGRYMIRTAKLSVRQVAKQLVREVRNA